jgi:DNA-dependent protein kinase catalytic subunit
MDCVFDVAKGVRGVNARADPANANVCASAAAQVECLVDLATDPNVLGRQWIGLSAWM